MIQVLDNEAGEISQVIFSESDLEELRWMLSKSLNTTPPETHKSLFQLDALLNPIKAPSQE